MTENDLCELGEQFYRERGWEVLREVPFAGRSIDMLLVRPETGKKIGIEFKLRDWKKALYQATILQLGMTWAFIAMPKPKRGLNPKCVEWAKDMGIGIILFTAGNFRVALCPNSTHRKMGGLRATRSHIIPHHRNRLQWAIQYIRDEEKDRLPNECWSDWAMRHNIYAKSRT